MFKQLRNKFLVLNLVIISIMMLIAFTSIYLITYNNVHKEIERELRRLAQFNMKMNEPIKESYKVLPPVPEPKKNADFPQKRSVSFTLTMDYACNTIDIFSVLDMEESFYTAAKNEALISHKNQGTFKLEGNHWAFMIKQHPAGYKIAFLDITPQQNILMTLIYTFLAVACIMLIFIFLISRFFANKAIEPISEAFDKQKQFIADASHELKTPLAVINTNIDAVLSNSTSALGDDAKWLHYIKSETERMAKLTNDLLYLTQVDHSEIKTVFSYFDFSETALDAVLTMEAIFFENNISLQYTIEPHLMIHGSSEQIKQVIIILLDNAAKYTNPKGKVDVTLSKQHTHAVLTVTNTGDGIPPEALARLFDRFYRVDKARSRSNGSYGLGLSIAEAILKQHGGKISVKSTLQESTTFCIELPC